VLIPIICLLIPVSIAVGIIIEQANRAIVLEDSSMFGGLKRGWEISKSNIGPLIVMALILFGITLVLGIIIALPSSSLSSQPFLPLQWAKANPSHRFILRWLASACMHRFPGF